MEIRPPPASAPPPPLPLPSPICSRCTWPLPPAPRPHLCSCPCTSLKDTTPRCGPLPPALAHPTPPPTRDSSLSAGAALPILLLTAAVFLLRLWPAASPACIHHPRFHSHLLRSPILTSLLCPPPSGPPSFPQRYWATRKPPPQQGRNSPPARPLPTGSTPPFLSGGGPRYAPPPHLTLVPLFAAIPVRGAADTKEGGTGREGEGSDGGGSKVGTAPGRAGHELP